MSEELGRIELTENPKYTIVVDEIDGTDNYNRAHRFGLHLPYGTIITVFDSPEPLIKDAWVAGMLEHTSKKLWRAGRGKNLYFNNVGARTSGRESLNRRTLVSVDNYSSAGMVAALRELYESVWVKDFATCVYHFGGVACGLFDAYVSFAQKAHEIGAGYLLVGEGHGFISDLDGDPLDDQPCDFNAKYRIIAAATPQLTHAILGKIET